MSLKDLFRSDKDESRIHNAILADMDYTQNPYNLPTTPRRAPPLRKSLAASRRKSMSLAEKATEFDKIAKSYLECEKKLIEAVSKSRTFSLDKKLNFIVRKRDECTESQSNILDREKKFYLRARVIAGETKYQDEINGGRRKRRRKTRRNKKRKSRRKSSKIKRKTKRRR